MNFHRLAIAGLGVLLVLGLGYFPLRESRESPEPPVFASQSTDNSPGNSSDFRVDIQPNGGPALSYLNFGEVAADLSGLTREELVERFNPRPRAPMSFAEAIGGGDPLDRAGAIYGMRWKGFVESLDLSDAELGRVREVFVAHEAHAVARRNHGQLAAALGRLLVEAGAPGDISTIVAREFKEIDRRLGVVND